MSSHTPPERHEVPENLVDTYITPREGEILRLLAQGNTTKQVAEELGLAWCSVHVHLSHASRRTNSSAYTLLYNAHKMGVVP